MGPGSPETRLSGAGQHELRPDLRGRGAGGTLATLSKVRGEREEGREGSRCVSEQLRIQCVVVRKVCDISSQICVSRDTDRIER